MTSLKKFFQYSIPFVLSFVYGINPPQSGQFPVGFWDQMEEQEIGIMYGDSGWVKKIADKINRAIINEIKIKLKTN